MEEQNNKPSPTPKEKKKAKADTRRSSTEPLESTMPTQPAQNDAKEEIKKFKESLLQTLSTGEKVISESGQIASSTESERERKRSTPRPPPVSFNVRGDTLAELDEAKLFELKEAFLLFDLDGDGFIDYTDLRGTLVSLGEQVDDQAVRRMLAEATNPLDFEAFVTLLGYKTLELDAEETLIAALSRWDRNSSGLISEERIRHDLMTWGDKFTEKEAEYALEEAPLIQKGGRPMIDYIRFCSQLCGLRKGQNNQSKS